jgi:hypothetical protein
MFNQYLDQLNFIALLVTALGYWLLGLLWFTIFGKRWQKEVEEHGITVSRPSGSEMSGMMIGTLIYAILVCFAVSYLLFISQTNNATAALKLGALVGACISIASLGITYIWEKRSFANLAIDGGYHLTGVILAAEILTLWH